MKISGRNARRPQRSQATPKADVATPARKRAPAAAPRRSRGGDVFEAGRGRSSGEVIRSNARVVRGTPGDDIIIGGSASQRILGGGGNDIILGGGGGDRIVGGAGNDRIRAGAGGDTVHGGRGRDRIAGGRGNDALHGGAQKDRLMGEIGDDHLRGGKGNDHAAGGMGIDVLQGGAGNDVQSGDAGPDFIHGGRGNDTVSFQTQTGSGFDPKNPNSGVLVDGKKKSAWRSTYEGVRYSGSAYGGSRAQGGSGVDGLQSNEDVVGSAKDDLVRGDFRTVEGGPGRDEATGRIGKRISASGEPDRAVSTKGAVVDVFRSSLTGGVTLSITGGAGNDRITVRRKGDLVTITHPGGIAARGGGKVQGKTFTLRVKGPIDAIQVEGGDGHDRLQVSGFKADVPVTLSGGNGNDRLLGGRGNDVLNDGAGNDVLHGGGGDDGLTNSLGRDRLFGDDGNDLLVSSSIDRGDRLSGGKGLDNVSFAQAGHDFAVRAKLRGFAQRLGADGKVHGPRAWIAGTAEDLEGTEGDDVLTGDGRDNKLLGRGGADVLLGLAGEDRLDARYDDKDRRLDGGRGRDRATTDREDRSVLRRVETLLRQRHHGPAGGRQDPRGD